MLAHTAMVDGIYERKYELDSLANVLHLAALYWQNSGKADHGKSTRNLPFRVLPCAAVACALVCWRCGCSL